MATITIHPKFSPKNILHIKRADGTIATTQEAIGWLVPQIMNDTRLAMRNDPEQCTRLSLNPGKGGAKEVKVLDDVEDVLSDPNFMERCGLSDIVIRFGDDVPDSAGGKDDDEECEENDSLEEDSEMEDGTEDEQTASEKEQRSENELKSPANTMFGELAFRDKPAKPKEFQLVIRPLQKG
ncbi:hypothetical protein PMZ80_005597 [Knufia obscura]|uniref:Uncharacterized protein n=1 Tax=Knufia obscura TaxID=1635080 RepID=A0ABR0RN46_9EURO|nr:hypothetical protein PMZ80_005597 [Knufia obscura]